MAKINEELKIISDNQYWVGDSRVEVLSGGVVYVEAIGEQTDDIARMHWVQHELLKEKFLGQISYVIDLNRCGKNSHLARQTWIKMMQSDRVYKVALFGLHPVAKVMASFVMGVTRGGNFKFFFKKEEALKWIRV